MLRFVQIDSFSAAAFGGNPAVVIEPVGPRDALDEAVMQQIAGEMNVAETAFLTKRNGSHGLRWFTPVAEVDLCGHATLAAAHALWTEWGEDNPVIRFETLSGELLAIRMDGLIWLDFPSESVEPLEASAIPVFSEAVKSDIVNVGENRMDLLVELASESAVRELDTDFAAIKKLGRQYGKGGDKRGLIVTAAAESGSDYDFVSRFFAPALGIDEDPVTGSAHCALAPYWADRLDRSELLGYQASARGGFVRVRTVGDRVHLGGEAVTILAGEIRNIE